MAMQIERRPRPRRAGRRYIGPKIQVNVPEEVHDFIVREHRLRGMREEEWPDLLREVFAKGAAAIRAENGSHRGVR